MMNKYEMTLLESYAIKFTVEAYNLQEAYSIARDKFWSSEVEAAVATPNSEFIVGDIIDGQKIDDE